jgi:hypothetical protein
MRLLIQETKKKKKRKGEGSCHGSHRYQHQQHFQATTTTRIFQNESIAFIGFTTTASAPIMEVSTI